MAAQGTSFLSRFSLRSFRVFVRNPSVDELDEEKFSDIKISSIEIQRNLAGELIVVDRGAYGIVWKARGVISGNGKVATLALKQLKYNFGSFPEKERSLAINEGKILSDLTLRHLKHISEGCPKRLRNERCNEGTHYVIRGYPCLREQTYENIHSPVWLPTRFLDGKTVQENLIKAFHKQIDDFTLQEKITILKQVALGCQAIAEGGDIHGDLKSTNIIVRRKGEKPFKSKIIDLGSAGLRRYQMQKKMPKKDYLTTSWCRHPKDELMCSSFGIECDLFAIGCLIYNLITHCHLLPFNDLEPSEIWRYNPKNDQRIVFMAIMEKLNGKLKEEWFKTANFDQVLRFYIQNDDGTFTFRYNNDFTPLKDVKDVTRESLILQPLLKAGEKKGYPPDITEKLYELIYVLISYDPFSYEELLEKIQQIEELLATLSQ